MAILLKQSTSATLKLGPFIDDTDGKTAETALTIAYTDVILSKSGGAGAAKHNTTASAHDTKGLYFTYLDGNDVGTLGELRLDSQITGALPVWDKYLVVPANPYDSLISGSDYLQADVENWANAAVAAMAATTWGTASNVGTVANVTNGVTLASGQQVSTASNVGTVASLLSNADKTGYGLADAAITAAKIATDAIDADALAGDAVSELQSGLATTGSLNTVAVNVAAILADTGTDGVVIASGQTVATASNAPSAAAIANQIGQRVPDGTSTAGSVDWSIGLVSGRLRDEETATAATTATRTLYKPNGTESWGTYVVNTSASLASYITGTRDS